MVTSFPREYNIEDLSLRCASELEPIYKMEALIVHAEYKYFIEPDPGEVNDRLTSCGAGAIRQRTSISQRL